jgi:hypothetical protein
VASPEKRPGARRDRKLSAEREAEIEQERLKQLAKIPPRAKGSPNVRKVFLGDIDAPFHSGDPPENDEEAPHPEPHPEPEPPAIASPEEDQDEGEPKLARRKRRRLKLRDTEKGWGKYHGTLGGSWPGSCALGDWES